MFKKIFYLIKPFIPRALQLFLRRKMVIAKLPKYKDIWPILKGSERTPENWKGWPENKQFAVVLTHDVEHQKGYDKVLELMEIEKNIGFKSSFNFIPERDYKVKRELLDTLIKNGFEYGVHGLHHDGKLFLSEEEFLRRAEKINRYLNEWNAHGFRAPAMHHNLDWIGALNIDYDLSTFDTDPFEPQPDGTGTIFPFWVNNKRHKNGGFVELPYTLPQDFTPFILMRNKTIKIWREKADWIAGNGGMILVNVHPDYINFRGEPNSIEEFPLHIYTDLLYYLNNEFRGKFWNPLPYQLANFYVNNIKIG